MLAMRVKKQGCLEVLYLFPQRQLVCKKQLTSMLLLLNSRNSLLTKMATNQHNLTLALSTTASIDTLKDISSTTPPKSTNSKLDSDSDCCIPQRISQVYRLHMKLEGNKLRRS